MIVNAKLVDFFSDIVESVAEEVVQRKLPLYHTSGVYIVGDSEIKKDDDGYTVLVNDEIVYKGLYLFESAYLLAYYKKSSYFSTHRQLLHLESEYQKHMTDMMYYNKHHKDAKHKKEYDVMDIMRSRYVISYNRAINIKNSLRSMCGHLLLGDK